jgi:hypothetical protein
MSELGSENEHHTYYTHNILYLLALSTRSNKALLKNSTIYSDWLELKPYNLLALGRLRATNIQRIKHTLEALQNIVFYSPR